MENEVKETNNLREVQNLMLKQMKRLDGCTARDETKLEIGRSGALSQNAQAYLKSMSIGLRVKELTKMNPAVENKVLKEIGAIE